MLEGAFALAVALVQDEPERVSFTAVHPGLPETSSSMHAWSCGPRVLTLQVSWRMTIIPDVGRRVADLRMSALIDGWPVVDSAFEAYVEETRGYVDAPGIFAQCTGDDGFTLRSSFNSGTAWWHETRTFPPAQ